MKRAAIILISVILLLPAVAAADLSGKWSCDDGGIYYLTQIGDVLFWYGERSDQNPAWSNIFQGRIQENLINGRWVDVPKGRTKSHGKLQLRIGANGNVLKVSHKTGGFGGSRWTRVGYRPAADVKEDCVGFNPRTTKVKNINGRWKIVDGSHWMFDFNNNKAEAIKALQIIKYYGMKQSCFVGRPDPSFQYMLVSGKAPAGSMAGEDCLAFSPQNARVKLINGRWKIVDGNHWLFDFGNQKKEAYQALAIIRKYQFTFSCFVGRPGPSFKYLRR